MSDHAIGFPPFQPLLVASPSTPPPFDRAAGVAALSMLMAITELPAHGQGVLGRRGFALECGGSNLQRGGWPGEYKRAVA